jgi:diguanylate cyclase (GGDEF)-like protein/PAS domain S-box-containing protein
MPEGVVIADARGRIESINQAFESSTGYSRSEVVGKSPWMLRSPRHDPSFYRSILSTLRENGRWQGEVWIRRKDGEVHPEWLSINALCDEPGRVMNYISIFSDVEAHRDVKQRLHHLAYYDGLTDLPNRQLFRDRLDLSLAQARRARHSVAVMFIDLDRFKHVNDTLGHRMGDRILKAVAERVKRTVRESDTVARIGGDEFTVILPELTSPVAASNVARKILQALEPPFSLAGREFCITASIGISIYPADGRDGAALTRKADIAMYQAKKLGRNHYLMYRKQMSADVRRRVVLENELRRALGRGEMYLLYQPQIDLRSGRLVGVEALARWRHPQLGLVPPATFIAIAEETDVIDEIGDWVLLTACRETRPWAAMWPDRFRVAVNVSARQLYRGEFAERVVQVLEQTSMRPDQLALELTASVMAEHFAAHGKTLESLSSLGVQITIDDFGTGYSSLGYLKRFCVDKLKIDQSFVHDIPANANDRALASMIIALAHASNMRVTAEGVETTEQLEFLRQEGCDEIQGFLISEPVPAATLTRMFEGADVHVGDWSGRRSRAAPACRPPAPQ